VQVPNIAFGEKDKADIEPERRPESPEFRLARNRFPVRQRSW
jgi:hypothetical protein